MIDNSYAAKSERLLLGFEYSVVDFFDGKSWPETKDMPLFSIAISLKRIADALEKKYAAS